MTPSPSPHSRECVTCGFPTFRSEGHAEWCADIADLNAAEPERCSGRKLTPAQVREMREMRRLFTTGLTYKRLGDEYGVSASSAWKIVNRWHYPEVA